MELSNEIHFFELVLENENYIKIFLQRSNQYENGSIPPMCAVKFNKNDEIEVEYRILKCEEMSSAIVSLMNTQIATLIEAIESISTKNTPQNAKNLILMFMQSQTICLNQYLSMFKDEINLYREELLYEPTFFKDYFNLKV